MKFNKLLARYKQVKISQKRFQGISDYPKESSNGQIPNTYYFGRAINYRDDPQGITLMPGPIKESGGVVIDLLKWADIVPVTLTSFLYGNAGNVYSRTPTGVWTNLFTVPGSHGNGLGYFSGDDYIYITGDSNISRYGPTQNNPQFVSNFLTAQGGVPQNTASLLLVSASSQYAHAADSASLSIISDLTLETYFKANSLPIAGASMTLIGKWDLSTVSQSYKLDLFGVSGYFGNGMDGALTISSNTTETPVDSACTGVAGTNTLSASNAAFLSYIGYPVLIIQTQGPNAGQYERNTINGYTLSTMVLQTNLIGTYTAGAQVRVLPQYTNVTINTGITYSPKAWNGSTGGILAFLANGNIAVPGIISGNALGYRGGQATAFTSPGGQGEGTASAGNTVSSLANGNGGGGGTSPQGAGGGGNGTAGQTVGGNGGSISGSNDLTTMTFGGGGGSADDANGGGAGVNGGNGGGIIFLTGVSLTVTGNIFSLGGNGTQPNGGHQHGGSAGGAGGSILLKVQTATLGSGLITANGGTGGIGTSGGTTGGNGGDGRVMLDYLISYTGTTTPTLNFAQDNTLVTTTTIQARLGISDNGSSVEYLTQNLMTLTTGSWNRLSVSWAASTSTATFYLNAVQIGTSIGTKTSISNNASLLYVGNDMGTSSLENYFDGFLNDMRIWSNVQNSTQIFNNNNVQVPVASSGLQAYYKFNSTYTDSGTNSNTLTAVNAPTFTSDVPFPGLTTRLDIDTQNTNVGHTYTVPTSIIEDSTNMLDFTPVNDPQASVGFYVDTKGTGNWTVTVHDQQNRLIATSTLPNASIPASGFVEFIFSPSWRLLLGETYHLHLNVSTGTSKIVTGVDADFSSAEYATYFGFLVTDTQFHPVTQFQYEPLGGTLTGAEIIGNERYIAVWDGANYLPNFLTFPPGWKVRCFAQWRQYLAIGMWRGGNIYDFHQGRIYFWSGTQPAYDFFIDVPEGQINALFGVDSDLYMFAGFRGILLDYKGGYFYNTGNSASNKLKRMPLLSPGDYTEVYPGALNMWRGLLHFGLYVNSNSTTVQKGVYSFGTLNQWYPDTLSYDYVISTGNKSTSVSIGLVYPAGQNLIIGWQDGIAYGADVVNFNNNPASSGELQLLIADDNVIWREKLNLMERADHLPLNTGEGVDVKFQVDRQGYITSPVNSAVGDSSTKQNIGDGRGHEYQYGVDLYATGSTSPTLLGISILHDDLSEEENFG